jgi:F0F1-type ATP synthase assembly protein I
MYISCAEEPKGMSAHQQDQSDKQKPVNAYLKYSGLAFQLLATIGAFGWLGYKLDQFLSLKFPAFMLLFGLMAFGGMMYQVYRSLNKP